MFPKPGNGGWNDKDSPYLIIPSFWLLPPLHFVLANLFGLSSQHYELAFKVNTEQRYLIRKTIIRQAKGSTENKAKCKAYRHGPCSTDQVNGPIEEIRIS